MPGAMPGKPQNIYDNADFFSAYSKSRDENTGLNDDLEIPALRSLITDVPNVRALDLGCGAGGMSRWLVEQGARSVIAVDVSERMLEVARSIPHPKILFRRSSAEELQLPASSLDLVVSSLMFHYIEDLSDLLGRVRRWLANGGVLVFSMEHPITTAGQGLLTGWERDPSGQKLAWRVGNYASEGKRVSRWIVDGVVKYHRTTATVLNLLIDSDFQIRKVLEPHAVESAESERPELLEERMRPPFLLVAATAV